MSNKIGRNDPCPCGNGKKYKHCHGSPTATTPPFKVTQIPLSQVPPEVLAQIRRQQTTEADRVKQYGHVKPPISAEYHGHHVEAVGGRLYIGKNWKNPTGFLFDYPPLVFGKEWWKTETKKPFEQRHPAVILRDKAVEYVQAHKNDPEEIPGRRPANGHVAAFLAFASDLYTVEHNAHLDDEFMQRILHREHFQGARHELFAEATCLRAGFTVEHEDEKDRRTRHSEFIVTHKATGQKLSVEAKSRHRPGVLAMPGAKEVKSSVRFGDLLNDAVAKNPLHPLVVFLDTNLPFENAERVYDFPDRNKLTNRVFCTPLQNLRAAHQGKDPINLVVYMNHPHNYLDENQLAKKHVMGVISNVPTRPVNLHVLKAIHDASELYGDIPHKFPENN